MRWRLINSIRFLTVLLMLLMLSYAALLLRRHDGLREFTLLLLLLELGLMTICAGRLDFSLPGAIHSFERACAVTTIYSLWLVSIRWTFVLAFPFPAFWPCVSCFASETG